MAARAIWKGVIKIGTARVPVKFYSAVHEHTIHFRLLHKTDHAPVQQKLVSSATSEPVEREVVRKAFPVTKRELVILENEDLEKLEPKPSRDIEVKKFVSPESIDHRWYERAYFLGPDTDKDAYFAAAEALRSKKKEGIARWVMRNRAYVGALRYDDGYLMLITLRLADEIIDAEALEPPAGRALDAREVKMAEQLVDALEERFDPTQFRDEYRERVMDLIKTKSRGGKVKVARFTPKKTTDDKLDKALQASLAGLRRKGAAVA
jgi:DNA end-binding protein Ku